MTEFIIRRILSLIAGITADQWRAAVSWVQIAAENATLKTGAERKASVERSFRAAWPLIQAFALNWLIETALAWVRYRNR